MSTHTPDPSHTETVHEREVIVTDGGSSRNGPAMVVVVVLAALALAFIGYVALGGDGVDTVVPDEIDVNVEDGSDSGTSGETGSSDSGDATTDSES